MSLAIDQLASEAELELCGFDGECNFCEAPTGRVWARMSRGDGLRGSEFFCVRAMPPGKARRTHSRAEAEGGIRGGRIFMPHLERWERG